MIVQCVVGNEVSADMQLSTAASPWFAQNMCENARLVYVVVSRQCYFVYFSVPWII